MTSEKPGSIEAAPAATWDGSRLEFWLRHDTWTLEVAAALFLNVDPDTIRYDDGDDDEDPKIIMFFRLNESLPFAWDDSVPELRQYRRQFRDLVRVAKSAQSDTDRLIRTPIDWINWALAKRVQIPWLDWARSKSLVTGELKSIPIAPTYALDKAMAQRERSSLLVVIAALAKELKIDLRQTSKAAGVIENLTVKVGSRVAARTIEEYLKKVPDALERRVKE